jgi:L-asparagine oxygenase
MSVPVTDLGLCEISHDARARARLETTLAGLGDPSDSPRDALALAEGLRDCFSLPVRSATRELRDCPGSSHGVLVRNAGRDPSLPPTPSDAAAKVARTSYVGEWTLLLLASSLGTVVSYREQRAGQLFNNILPMRGSEDEVSSQGSRTELGLHRECTFSDVGPDFIGLYCHRGGDVATYIVSAARLQHCLSDRQWEILRQPRFATPVPPLFRRDSPAAAAHHPHSIFLGERDNPEIRVDTTLTRGTDHEAEAALDELRTLAWHDDVLERVVLNPGDLLLLDNRKCLHGRQAFTANFDGSDRWLVRLYVKTDLWTCRERLVGDHVLIAGQYLTSEAAISSAL